MPRYKAPSRPDAAYVRAEGHPRAKLTWASAEAIRSDRRPLAVIAAEYGISQALVSQVRRGRRWRPQDRPSLPLPPPTVPTKGSSS